MSDIQAKVIMYSTQFCPYCIQAKNLLNSKQVTISEIDIDHEPDKYSQMVQKSGGITSVPQIFINDFHVGGCDDLHDLEAQGGLDELLFPK